MLTTYIIRDRTFPLARQMKILSFMTATALFVSMSFHPAQASTDLPVVNSSALGKNMNIPWSQPVKVNDPFEGSYLGVFDKNYFFRRFLNDNVKFEVLSLWSRNNIRFLLAYTDRDCLHSRLPILPIYNCSVSDTTQKVTKVLIKVGEQVFQVSGQNNTFAVNNELAKALKASPVENIKVRLVTENGETIDSEIGKGTVKSWKDIY